MKITKKSLCIALSIIVCIISSYASVSSKVSPTLDIIEKTVTLQKCTVLNRSVTFDEEDFDKSLSTDVKYVTINSLPSPEDGTLYLRGVRVLENQTVSRDELSMLYFEPSTKNQACATFDFSDTLSQDVTAVCKINILEDENTAPTTSAQTFETQKNVSAFKFLTAKDKENDELSYEIVKYPSKGALHFTDAKLGAIEYIPKLNYVGKDSFVYKVYDEYGNASPEQKVTINVAKPSTDKYFDDMKRHWGHNSAIKMASTGLMGGREIDGLMCFEPDNSLSRGDFLAISLIMAGFEEKIPYVDTTSFADDDGIPSNIRSYAQYALENGIVTGYGAENAREFKSTESITRAEAAVIIDRILALPETTSSLPFSDSIPTWASSSVSSLYDCGILKGNGNGWLNLTSVLTKAEGAEIVCNVAQYLEDKENQTKKAEKKQKNLFNLFGLLS